MTMAMSNDGLVLTGFRPPSVLSNYRPNSAKQPGYHTVARNSSVDESLFKSYYTTKLDEVVTHTKAPWECPKPQEFQNTFTATTKKKPPKVASKPEYKGPPLLWSPTPRDVSNATSSRNLKSASNNASCLWSTKHHFRHLKHKPSFVDESLFGSRLDEPSFQAPWNERKKGEKKEPRPFLWGPPMNELASQNEFKQSDFKSSLRPNSARSTGRPVWKP